MGYIGMGNLTVNGRGDLKEYTPPFFLGRNPLTRQVSRSALSSSVVCVVFEAND